MSPNSEYDAQAVLAEFASAPDSGTGSLKRYYVDGPTYIDEHLLMHNDGPPSREYFYVPQEFHTVSAMIDASGNLVDAYTYDAYGQVSIFDRHGTPESASNVGNPYTFTGRRLDRFDSDLATPRLDLYHYRARAYTPVHGRFLQRDPSGYVDGMNLYEYVSSGPTRYGDPSGRRKIGFKFAAFISSNFPLWNDEPWDLLHEFRGDARGAGRAGSSRLSTEGWVESTKIGRLGLGDGYIFTDSGTSFRRNKITGSVTSAKASVGKFTNLANNGRKCKSTFVVTASSAYPFSAFAPDIDYFITISFTVVRDGVILAEMKGGHDSFPDYEGLVDRVLGHSYPTPFAGPSLGNLGSSNPGVQFSTQWLVNARTPKCCP